MEFLKKVGTDTLINTLAVNPKGNTDTEVCNKLQDILFCEFSGNTFCIFLPNLKNFNLFGV